MSCKIKAIAMLKFQEKSKNKHMLIIACARSQNLQPLG